ncbi:MAG TPA: HDIG domain-containing protein [Anaerolineae bacterium]|nr:HDIG domain-containing protein [Anaerolineae bacterium]
MTSGARANTSDSPTKLQPSLRSWLLLLAFGALFIVGTTLALVVRWPTMGQFTLRVDDVSPTDIRAPQFIEYISEVLTEEARVQAERRVTDVYEPVRRARSEQLARADEVVSLVASVRADQASSLEQKLQAVGSLPDVQIEQEEWQALLALDGEAWERVADEVPTVLSFVMLSEIRDNQLAAIRRRVPSFIDLVNDDEARVVIALVRALTKPNMAFNEERTLALREEARAAVPPQVERFEEGEIIVRTGDLITARHIEALQALGLNQPGWEWWRLAAAVIIASVMALIFGLYAYGASSVETSATRQMGLLVALLLAFLLLAKFMIPERTVLPYMFPLAAVTMLVGTLLGMPIAFLTAVYFGVMAAYLSNGNVDLVVYLMLGGLVGTLVLRKGERTSAFVTAGAAVSGVSLALLLAFNLPLGGLDLTGAIQLATAGLANGAIAASITLIGFYLLGAIFDIATPLRLMELARPNHPLLRDLVTKAPGTYHHSLLVSNMAEQAAEAIGADAFLTRVGAYYHDIGKINRPYFFAENRMQGIDPHTQLDPWSSAKIIINHVKDGEEMARRHKLPHRVRDFIAEHQGTGIVRVFYHQAQQAAAPDTVDEKDFRYPGPKPQSRETALVMLADSCESAVRAMRPETKEEIDELVRKIINQKLIEGELSQSPLTLMDLETTRRIFVQSLQGAHHPRIVYPEAKTSQPAVLGANEPTSSPTSEMRSDEPQRPKPAAAG